MKTLIVYIYIFF